MLLIMKTAVKLCLVLFIFISSNIYGQTTCKVFNSYEVISLQKNIYTNTLPLKEDGSFVDFSKGELNLEQINQEDANKRLKKYGLAKVFFPDHSSYIFLNEYLKKITNIPCSFEDKDIVFQNKRKKYVFNLSQYVEGVIAIKIRVIGKKYIESIGYPQTLYIYLFEREQKTIVLTEINIAG